MRDSDQPGGREQRSMDTVHILVADDHPLYRRGLRNLLSALPDIEVVGEARTGEEAVALAEQLQPDVIIMDLQMPGMSGIEATRQIVQTSPHIGVLVVTMFEDDHSVYEAIGVGARGYVLKDAEEEELLRAISVVAHGAAIFCPTAVRTLRPALANLYRPANEAEECEGRTPYLAPAARRRGQLRPAVPDSSRVPRVSHTFGDLLRRYRLSAGLTQEELAERAALSVRGISDLERGVKQAPRRSTVQLLVGALGLSEEDEAALGAAIGRRRGPWSASLPARLGIGLDAGEAASVEGGYWGGDLYPTARLFSLAGPGEVSARSTSAVWTFLVADIRQYTRFTLDHGDEAAAELADRFASITEEVVAPHAGQVIELRGDEVLVAFSSTREAIRAALALQRQFALETECHPDRPLEVGIGVDAGEAVPVRGGYRGTSLNLAARLCALAEAGEVLVSETIVTLARRIEGVVYTQRPPANLKGFGQPVEVIAVSTERHLLGPPPSSRTPFWLEDRQTEELPSPPARHLLAEAVPQAKRVVAAAEGTPAGRFSSISLITNSSPHQLSAKTGTRP